MTYEKEVIAGAVLDLEERLACLARDINARGDFDRRVESLKAARAHVAEMLNEKADRSSHPRHLLNAQDRIAQELKVARYLMGDDA